MKIEAYSVRFLGRSRHGTLAQTALDICTLSLWPAIRRLFEKRERVTKTMSSVAIQCPVTYQPLLVEKGSGSKWRGFESFESFEKFENDRRVVDVYRVHDHDRGTRMAIIRSKLLKPISEHFPRLVRSKELLGNGNTCERLHFPHTRWDPFINDLKIVFFLSLLRCIKWYFLSRKYVSSA